MKKYLYIDGVMSESAERGLRIAWALDPEAVAPIRKLLKQARGAVKNPAEWAGERYRFAGGKGCHPIN